jgi:hypothetical protein
VPEYTSAAGLLEDARLRLDALGDSAGILIVEGFDDRRVFAQKAKPQQIVVSGGRKLLLAAHRALDADDLGRLVFLTDCDHEVSRGTLKGAHDLIITRNRDVESDLLELGGLRKVLLEVVPRACDSEHDLDLITTQVMTRITNLAEPIGRLRNALQSRGEELNLTNLDLSKVRPTGSDLVDVDRLVRTIVQRSHMVSTKPQDALNMVQSEPGGYRVCNGHDLLAALSHVLREDFNRGDAGTPHLAGLLRSTVLDSEIFEQWTVVRRIRAWQRSFGRFVLP